MAQMISTQTNRTHAGICACPHAHPHPVAKPLSRPAASAPEHSPDSVALGVRDVRGQHQVAFNTAQAALWSVDAAVQAASQGTFGVGGALLGPHKELLAISCNRVVADGKVADPTAHGERQLVDWYFEKLHQGETLPSPQECTIVSSLDPCMMCAGSILTAGFRVASTTLDTTAGVNYTTDGRYPTVPEELRQQTQQQFAYIGVEGKRDFAGEPLYGERPVVAADVEQRSLSVFLDSLPKVQQTIHSDGLPVADLRQCADQQVVTVLKNFSPQALSLHFPPGQPGPELAETLLQAADEAKLNGGVHNAAALIDPHGNLVLVSQGQEGQSPVRTAFMELTRTWTTIRAQAGPNADKYLAPLKDCTVITLHGPGRDSTSIMDIGAYGSSVEGPLPPSSQAAWQYVLPRQEQALLNQEIQQLPPLYSQIIRPRIEQVADADLIALCSP